MHESAVQRVPHLTVGQRSICWARTFLRPLDVAHDDRVERRVELVDALRIGQFQTADLALAQEGGEFVGGEENLVHGNALLVRDGRRGMLASNA